MTLSNFDDQNWQERSEYWQNDRPKKPGRQKKYKFRKPLILCGHGIRIRIHRNSLLIRNGFTHFPQEAEEIRLFPGDGNMPDRIVLLDCSGGISFEALNWMAEQDISLVQLDYRGRVKFVTGYSGQFAKVNYVRWQLSIQGTEKAARINRDLIQTKFVNSVKTLLAVFPKLESTKIAISRISENSKKLAKLPINASPNSVLGLEGAAAAEYFRAWHKCRLSWKTPGRIPIPPTWSEIGSRQMTWRKDANRARHPINAMLNYGYAILASDIHAAIAAAGFDPAIGIAHRRHTNSIPLAYDLMEPLRPVVDQKILEFVIAHIFAPKDFTIDVEGGCRLNPQLAKTIVKSVSGSECGSIVEKLLLEHGSSN